MKTQSAKAKGRRLQQKVVKMILETFPHLSTRDVRSTSMGNQGVDVQLSDAAHLVMPYSIECKNVERNKGLTDMYLQAQANTDSDDSTPLLVISCNNAPTLAILALKDLLTLRKDYEHTKS
jgi:hypothetical protein